MADVQFMATQERLARHTSFRIGGPAEFFFRPETRPELIRTICRCRRAGMPVRLIGAGTNLLVSDRGVAGAVVATSHVRQIEVSDHTITAECGARLSRLIAITATGGLSGLEPLAGIPGSLGGAIAVNAGTNRGCIADVVADVTVLTPAGELEVRQPHEIGFGYRSTKLAGAAVLSATLNLQPSSVRYVRSAVRQNLRVKAAAQPLGEPSAGCAFKNPPGDFAARIIDNLGLKGRTVGGARVSEKHANFIVNLGWATSADVLELIEAVRSAVLAARQISLELEIEVW